MSETASIVRRSRFLTGATGQIKLSHIRKKPWCGPGVGLVRAWCALACEGVVRQTHHRRCGGFQGRNSSQEKNPVLPQSSPRGGRTCGNLRRRGVGVFDAPTGGVVSNTPTPKTRKLLQTAGMPLQDRSRGAGALRNSHWTKAARTYVNMFEGPVTGNIPEVLDNGED